MPAFARAQERDGCQAGEDFKDPDSMYDGCHIRKELYYGPWISTPCTTRASPASPQTTATEQLYRLLALSLAGYYDRYHNQGACWSKEADRGNWALPTRLLARHRRRTLRDLRVRRGDGTDPHRHDLQPKELSRVHRAKPRDRDDEIAALPRTAAAPPPPLRRRPSFATRRRTGRTASATSSPAGVRATLQYGLFSRTALWCRT